MGAIPLPQPLPPYKDQLSMLFANLPKPGAPAAPGAAPGAVAPTMAAAPPAAPAPPIQPAAQSPVAPPSDDPAITAGRQSLDQSNTSLQEAIKAYQGTQSKIAAVPPVDVQANKPHWYDRLLAGVVGTAAGYGGGPQVAEQAAHGVAYRKLNQADNERQRQLDPLFQQLQSEKEGIPMYQAANEGAWRQFQGGLDTSREHRLQEADDNTIGSKVPEKGPDGKYYQRTKGGKMVEVEKPKSVIDDERKRDEDSNTPAPGARPEPDPTKKGTYRVKTKSGDYIPYTFKSVDEAALAKDPTGTALFNKAHPGPRDAKEKTATPGQFNAANRHKSVGIANAHKEFAKATEGLDPKDGKESTALAFQDAHNAYNEAVQQAQNAYEDEVETLGGSAKHVEIPPTKSGFEKKGVAPAAGDAAEPAPAAAPNGPGQNGGGVPATPPASLWEGKESKKSGTGYKRITIKDPKTGVEHVWDFKGGKPVMVKESSKEKQNGTT